MGKFVVSSKAKTDTAPVSREEFVTGSAMYQTQTGGRPLKPVRVNFDIDPDTHRRLKIRAIDRGMSVALLVRQLIDTELAS